MTAQDVAKYFLARASADGDLITPLKMQKLIYYAYVWVLVKAKGKKLFTQNIEAWSNGPVVADLYRELKPYGSMPVSEDYIDNIERIQLVIDSSGLKEILDGVYEEYMPKTAFELVSLTHAEEPWAEARRGLEPTDSCNVALKDSTILSTYSH